MRFRCFLLSVSGFSSRVYRHRIDLVTRTGYSVAWLVHSREFEDIVWYVLWDFLCSRWRGSPTELTLCARSPGGDFPVLVLFVPQSSVSRILRDRSSQACPVLGPCGRRCGRNTRPGYGRRLLPARPTAAGGAGAPRSARRLRPLLVSSAPENGLNSETAKGAFCSIVSARKRGPCRSWQVKERQNQCVLRPGDDRDQEPNLRLSYSQLSRTHERVCENRTRRALPFQADASRPRQAARTFSCCLCERVPLRSCLPEDAGERVPEARSFLAHVSVCGSSVRDPVGVAVAFSVAVSQPGLACSR